MANKFEVQIVALDRFTAMFRRLNNAAGKSFATPRAAARQFGVLAREMHVKEIGKGFEYASRAATGFARSLGLTLGPLESLLGVGAAGGIVAGVGLAAGAMVALGVNTAQAGFETRRTARTLGMTTDELQRMRGAARVAGVDVDSVTEDLKAFGTTLQDARWGRNPMMLSVLHRLGMQFKYTKSGIIDEQAMLNDLARTLGRVADPRIQHLIASGFGVEEMLPMLRDGDVALTRLADRAEELGLVQGRNALDWSEEFTNSLNDLKGAIGGLANEWGAKMLPMMTSYVKWLQQESSDTTEKGNKKVTLLPEVWGLRELWGPVNWAFDALRGPELTGPKDRIKSGVVGPAGSGLPEPMSWKTGPRSVSGRIGPYVPAGAASAASVPGGSASDAAMRAAVAMTPEEEAHTQAYDRSPANLAELRDQIARERRAGKGHESNVAVLQNELDNLVKVQVEFHNAPPGTTATATGPGSAYLPTLVHYSMPTEVTP